ncbi:MAG TPA: glucosaminidase domain-containing protein, partial [Methylomirabilota bacterium]|nr:glucosaminidase domain-containing protein [Methylomirabilota bacterium]
GKGRRDSWREGEIISTKGQVEGDEATKGSLYVEEKMAEQNLQKRGSLEKQGITENRGYYDTPEGLGPDAKFNPFTGAPLAKPIGGLRELFGFKPESDPDEVTPERKREYGWGEHESPGESFQARPTFPYEGDPADVRRFGVGRNQILLPGRRTGGGLFQNISDVRSLNEEQFNKAFAGTKMAGKYDAIVDAANRNGISPTLLAATIALETGYGKSRALKDYNNPAGLMSGGKDNKEFYKFATIEDGIERAAQIAAKNYIAGGETIRGMGELYAPIGAKNDPYGTNKDWIPGVTQIEERYTDPKLDYREKYQQDEAEKIDDDLRKAESVEKDKKQENVEKDDKEEKSKQDEQKDRDKPTSKEIEKEKSPRHDPEAESKGANDDGYGSQHRNSGDYTGTTDHDPDLDS